MSQPGGQEQGRGEVALPFVCREVAWAQSGVLPSLHLATCNSRESWPSHLLAIALGRLLHPPPPPTGQHSEEGSGGVGAEELTLPPTNGASIG